METPNVDSLGHSYFGRSWRDLDPPRHIYLFSRKTLDTILSRAGFLQSEVRTSAARTDLVCCGSAQIKETGRYDENGLSRKRWRLLALLFLIFELFLIRFQCHVGEELVVKAQK